MTDKKRNGGEWTEARFKSFVTSALRAASRRWPPKYKALKEAFVARKVNAKTGKMAMHYNCAVCQKLYVASDVQVDHIKPVVDPKKGFISWDDFILIIQYANGSPFGILISLIRFNTNPLLTKLIEVYLWIVTLKTNTRYI